VVFTIVVMIVILAVAGAVVLYAAFPHRGEEVPGAPWIGDVMSRAVDKLPTVEPEKTVERASELHR
jgi:hypothetical protein